MSKYQNGKIYKITSKNTEKVYVGSTCQELKTRLDGHIQNFKEDSGTSSKHVLIFGDYEIILIESHACENREELTSRERFYIESMNCVNVVKPGRSRKQHYLDNIEAIKKFQNTKYNCECGGKYTYRNRATHQKRKKHLKYLESMN